MGGNKIFAVNIVEPRFQRQEEILIYYRRADIDVRAGGDGFLRRIGRSARVIDDTVTGSTSF